MQNDIGFQYSPPLSYRHLVKKLLRIPQIPKARNLGEKDRIVFFEKHHFVVPLFCLQNGGMPKRSEGRGAENLS
jgi:hypothetical protein